MGRSWRRQENTDPSRSAAARDDTLTCHDDMRNEKMAVK
jgi:hypothetical protein